MYPYFRISKPGFPLQWVLLLCELSTAVQKGLDPLCNICSLWRACRGSKHCKGGQNQVSLSPSERQILYYKGESACETRKKWLLYNDFLQLGNGIVLNRPSICLNQTFKSALEWVLGLLKDGLKLRQFIYTLGRNAQKVVSIKVYVFYNQY